MPNYALTDFIGNLKAIDFTRARAERLYGEQQIALRDLHSMYEALFLRAVTSFEAFLEELFTAIMKEKVRYKKSRVSLRMKASSSVALMEILLQGQRYMMWLPFDHTVKRARLYLKDGKPFSELDDGDKSMLKTITVIRNAIAHKSVHAMSEFQNIGGVQVLLPRERNPAGFLRSRVGMGPARSRFETYISELGRIAHALC